MKRELASYLICVLALSLCVEAAAPDQTQRERPKVNGRKTHLDQVVVAGGLPGLWRAASEVVECDVSEPRLVQKTVAPDMTIGTIQRTAKIREAFKAPSALAAGDTIVVEEAVGPIQTKDGTIEVENGKDVLGTGVYVLFLLRPTEPNTYALVSSRGAAYRNARGGVQTDSASHAPTGKWDDLIARLREYRSVPPVVR